MPRLVVAPSEAGGASRSLTNLVNSTGFLLWCQKRKCLPAAELTSPPVQKFHPPPALPRCFIHSLMKSLSAWSSSSRRCASAPSQVDCAEAKLSFSSWSS